MKVTIFIIVLFIGTYSAFGQRIIEKSLEVKNGRFFYIDAKQAYKAILGTEDSERLEIKAIADGEYQEDIVLKVKETGSDLNISTDFSPDYQKKNDKLSAHKSLSVSLRISLPQNSQVYFKGSSTNLVASGNYKTLNVELEEGNCSLNQLKGLIRIVNNNGDIALEAREGTVDAASKYGQVKKEQLATGNSSYFLRSDQGNISVIRKL